MNESDTFRKSLGPNIVLSNCLTLFSFINLLMRSCSFGVLVGLGLGYILCWVVVVVQSLSSKQSLVQGCWDQFGTDLIFRG